MLLGFLLEFQQNTNMPGILVHSFSSFFSRRGSLRSSFFLVFQCFVLMRFSSAEGGGVVGIRCFLGRFNFTRRVLSLKNATSRFRAWEASSSAITTMPLGVWCSRTPVSLRSLLCPPGPDARRNSSTVSRSKLFLSVGYFFFIVDTAGFEPATPAM